ncbi:MAG: hypothetical protein E7590_08985 [Ruminococcaceae bacterium]|nr:hypothetical protein [Oscillospiraceae bacterium]
MLQNYNDTIKQARIPRRKRLKKLGTVKLNTVETTPVVWQDRLLRFEWVRNATWGAPGGIDREVGYYHFVDMETETPVCQFAADHSFGCCYAENGKMYVHGVRGGGGGNVLDTFVSSDLQSWESSVALTFPDDICLYNTSVCKGDGRYVMAIEIGGKNPAVGKPFTCVFAESTDLLHWSMLDMMEYSYSRDRYTACPCIRYVDGYYYMIYLEGAPCHRWIPYIVRSRDLKTFELGVTNPVMWPDDADKQVICPERFTAEELDYMEHAVDCNNSDFDLCDYQGKTVITYSWGNQYGKEFLALAEYDGSSEAFLKSFFE